MKNMVNKNKYIFGDKAVEKLAYELTMANCFKCGVLISKSDSVSYKLKLIKNSLSNIEYEILIVEANSDIKNIAKKIKEKAINALVLLGNNELINKGYEVSNIIKESNNENLPIVIITSSENSCNMLIKNGPQRTVIICDDRLINIKNCLEITNNAIDTLYAIIEDCCDNCSYIAIPSHIAVFNKIVECLANAKDKTLKKSQLIDLNRAIIESTIGLNINVRKLEKQQNKDDAYELMAQKLISKSRLNKSMEMFISHLECSENAILINKIKVNETKGKIEEILKQINQLRKKQ